MHSKSEPGRDTAGALTLLGRIQVPTSRRRLGWLVAALLQLALPPFAAAADATVERESQTVHAHIESHGARGCPRVHPADCVVCRVLANSGAPARSVALRIAIARIIDAEPARDERASIIARLAGDPPQRAPPA